MTIERISSRVRWSNLAVTLAAATLGLAVVGCAEHVAPDSRETADLSTLAPAGGVEGLGGLGGTNCPPGTTRECDTDGKGKLICICVPDEPSPPPSNLRVVHWGEPGDIPITADFDGDGRADFTVWRPTTGEWWTIRSATNTVTQVVWGDPGDVPVPADYDGDGKADFAVFRASTSTWWLLLSANNSVKTAFWGGLGDIAVPADYDGDGLADVAIWRPSDGVWWVAQSSGTVRTQAWGQAGDVPLTGSHDGHYGADFSVWRPSTRSVYTLSSSPFNVTGSQQLPSFDDVPVVTPFCSSTEFASWNKTTGVWSNTSFLQLVTLGLAGDIPVPANYDGVTSALRAVFRPAEGTWYIDEAPANCIN